ncbi:MAG: hypothetical protein AB9861_13195 [Methanosarcina sp.]
MQEKIKSLSTSKEPMDSATVISASILVLLLFSPAAAAGEWNVAPSTPYIGDNLVITGNVTPNQELTAEVSFEKTVIASGGKYEYSITKVKIPEGKNNLFTVKAEQVKNLNVQVKKLLWITLNKDAIGGTATISQSKVPPLTYEVKMYGDALEGESNVKLRITASQTINADSKGNFRYEYGTDTMPEGDYIITIGDTSKTITLKEWHSSSSHSDDHNIVKIRPKPNETGDFKPEENISGGEFEEKPTESPKIESNETNNANEFPDQKRPILVISLIIVGIICVLLWIYYTKKLEK